MRKPYLLMLAALLALTFAATTPAQEKTATADDPDARHPVTKDDVKIAQRARAILDTPAKWNRADNRKCPDDAKTFSLYCALEKATTEVSGKFAHRGAAMQEARFVIDDVAPNKDKYEHRLMDWNNDPTTTFADLQKVLRLIEERITKRLAEQEAAAKK